MNAPGTRNLCSKLTIETPEQTVKFALKVYKNNIEHIWASQLVLWVQFGTLNMYFQTGL